jgi:hypothetical protein
MSAWLCRGTFDVLLSFLPRSGRDSGACLLRLCKALPPYEDLASEYRRTALLHALYRTQYLLDLSTVRLAAAFRSELRSLKFDGELELARAMGAASKQPVRRVLHRLLVVDTHCRAPMLNQDHEQKRAMAVVAAAHVCFLCFSDGGVVWSRSEGPRKRRLLRP